MLILNKCDLIANEDLEKLEKVVRTLQPRAKIIKTVNSVVESKEILNTNLFDFAQASESAGWLKELNIGKENHIPETEEYGISSFVYSRKLPFHSERFNDWCETMPIQIVRAKGIAWCASRNNIALLVSQAGPSVSIEPLSYWVASLPEGQQQEILNRNPKLQEGWDEEFGDRHTKLVFIGIDLDVEMITNQLDACLLTVDEFDGEWSKLKDPFQWQLTS